MAAAVVVGGVLFLGASSPAYACTTMLQPVSPATAAPGETPRLGQVTRDLGRNHVETGYTPSPGPSASPAPTAAP